MTEKGRPIVGAEERYVQIRTSRTRKVNLAGGITVALMLPVAYEGYRISALPDMPHPATQEAYIETRQTLRGHLEARNETSTDSLDTLIQADSAKLVAIEGSAEYKENKGYEDRVYLRANVVIWSAAAAAIATWGFMAYALRKKEEDEVTAVLDGLKAETQL